MSWKFVFNSNQMGAGTLRKDAIELATRSGYSFICWNGEIFFIDVSGNGEVYETGITYEDMIK